MADQSSANVEFWDKFSDLYEELSTPTHTQYASHVLRLAKAHLSSTSTDFPSSSLRILDVAAGTGPFALLASQEFPTAKVLATDVSERQLMTAKKKADAIGGLTNLECRVMDGQALQVEDNSVDVLVCMFGMMFFDDKDKGWREFHRVLKPGGCAIITTWQALGIVPPLEEARAHVLGLPDIPEFPGFDRGRSMRDAGAIRTQALAAGFASADVEPLVVVAKNFKESDTDVYAGKFLQFPTFGSCIPEGKESEFRAELANVLRKGVDENGLVGITHRALVTVAVK